MTVRICERCGGMIACDEEVVLVIRTSPLEKPGIRVDGDVLASLHPECFEEIDLSGDEPALPDWDEDPDEEPEPNACTFCGRPIEVECAECAGRRIRGLKA